MLKVIEQQVTAFAQNCRLLIDEETKEAVVCDPGGNAGLLLNLIQRQGCKVKAILLTHGHLDHVGAALRLSQELQAEIIGPAPEDEFLISSLNEQAAAFGLPQVSGQIHPRYVYDGQSLNLLPHDEFEVITTPGHTPGGVCYYCKSSNLVLAGDTLFAGSVGRTDFPGGDFAALESSIKDKLFKLPPNTRVLTGHGPDTTIDNEMNFNPFVGRNKSLF